MNEPKVEGAPGRHFGTSEKFGRYPPAALLQALDESLPPRATVRFASPRGKLLMSFLREHGKHVKVHWWQWNWELLHVGRGGILSSLAAFVADHSITSLAVWFTVWDSNGECLLEMEGGNNYIWLAKEFEDDARVRIVEAAGGAIWPTEL